MAPNFIRQRKVCTQEADLGAATKSLAVDQAVLGRGGGGLDPEASVLRS
jgi:hypothetical protein